MLQVEQNLDRVLRVALRRVSECECGPETSCYGCLRSYQNQRDHDDLSRGTAEQVLRRLMENTRPADQAMADAPEVDAVPDSLPGDWVGLYKAAFGTEREMLVALAEAGVAQPELGFESEGGIPIALAWPERLIAVDYGLEVADREDLEAEGWRVLPLAELLESGSPLSVPIVIS